MPPLRRNGKQQACEPCRKGKLACDHAYPFCGRCTRRKTTARCIYHPAPMTKNKDAAVTLPPPVLMPHQQHQEPQRTPSNSTIRSDHLSPPRQAAEPFNSAFRPDMGYVSQPRDQSQLHQMPSQLSPNHSQMSPNHSQFSPNQSQFSPRNSQLSPSHSPLPPNYPVAPQESAHRQSSQGHDAPRARYSGPTGFSAMFTERGGISNVSDDGQKHAPNYPFGVPLLDMDGSNDPAVRTSQVLKALENVPSQEVCIGLLERYKNIHISMADVLVRHAVETLWQTFGGHLATPRAPEKLTAIADVLFANAQTPYPPPPDDGMDWLDTFMGPNLRFETLGVLFCFFGMSYESLPDWDELFKAPENQGRTRKQISWRMKECADICLKMCQATEENNEISLSLQVCTAILEGLCTGEESKFTITQCIYCPKFSAYMRMYYKSPR